MSLYRDSILYFVRMSPVKSCTGNRPKAANNDGELIF